MEATFRNISATIALLIEGGSAVIIAVAAVEALVNSFRAILSGKGDPDYREVYLRFGSRLILGLEFALAADIVRTAISPRWDDIGRLAAIAAIRTFLNFFLERDIERFAAEKENAARKDVENP